MGNKRKLEQFEEFRSFAHTFEKDCNDFIKNKRKTLTRKNKLYKKATLDEIGLGLERDLKFSIEEIKKSELSKSEKIQSLQQIKEYSKELSKYLNHFKNII